MTKPAAERRRFLRVSTEIPVQYTPQGAARGAKIRKDPMVTIGEGGCFIQTKLTYPKDTKLVLSFHLEESEIKCVAVVRYAVPYNSQIAGVQFPGMGLQFEIIQPDLVRKIRSYVERELPKQTQAMTDAHAGS